MRDPGQQESFRALFGDEQQDYNDALARHYEQGPPPNWRESYVSSYATMHPWEDFAETWAHYMHIVDTLETAEAFEIRVRRGPRREQAERAEAGIAESEQNSGSFDAMIDAWLPMTYAVNSLNRSMGQPDLYPFVLSQPAINKIEFVHELIQVSSGH